MALLVFIWTLLLVLGVDGGATGRCPASKETSFTLSVASRRNFTGHWIVSVDGVSELPQPASSPNSPMELVIDIGQRTASCEHLETVQLKATAVVDAASAAVHEETPQTTTSVDYVTRVTSEVPPMDTESTTQAPPAGYEVVNGTGLYKIHTDAATWPQARDTCVQEGAHLIVINSDQEAEVTKTLYARDESKIRDANVHYVHVGFDDIVTEGQYTTVLGEPLSSSGYTRWSAHAEHNNTESNCGIIDTDGSLHIRPCQYKRAFICELSAQ